MTMQNPATATIQNFKSLRNITVWAGCLGLIQSVIWMGLTITGIIAYNCGISVAYYLSYGSLLRTIFLDLYFKGNCNPSVYQNYNYTMLRTVQTVLNQQQILIWDCCYLAAATCWLLASVLLLTYLSKTFIRQTVTVMATWIFFTFAISAMDLSLGIIFGIDYGRFQKAAYNYNFNTINAGAIDPNASELIAGEVAAISLMIISFKGFILWLINVMLLIILFLRALHIKHEENSMNTLFMPLQKSNGSLLSRSIINAYDETKSQAYFNEAMVPDNPSVDTLKINEEAIIRAARMSRDTAQLVKHFSNIDSYQQYPPPATQGGTTTFNRTPPQDVPKADY